MAGFTGFSVLAWVKPDSPLLRDVTNEAAEKITTQLLQDFRCLLSCRWNMDLTIAEYEGSRYAFGINTRITASERTIKNAIGDLHQHVDFIRSTASINFEDLARYKSCRVKWNVPDQVTEGSYGWGAAEPPETSQGAKRKRF